MVRTESAGDSVMRFSLAGLVMAAATNVVVAVSNGVAWAWWVAATCLGVALLLGSLWSVRRRRARAEVARSDDVVDGRRTAGTSAR